MRTREKNQIASTTLLAAELDQLQSCEAIVEKGLRTFVEVGSALAEIRAGKLYLQDYDTLEGSRREMTTLGVFLAGQVGINPSKRNRQAPHLATPHFFNADEEFYNRHIFSLLGILVNLA
jgi:hypothetical protein